MYFVKKILKKFFSGNIIEYFFRLIKFLVSQVFSTSNFVVPQFFLQLLVLHWFFSLFLFSLKKFIPQLFLLFKISSKYKINEGLTMDKIIINFR